MNERPALRASLCSLCLGAALAFSALAPTQAQAQPSGVVDVRNYGAKGDCAKPVDDTAAIQAAIDAASPIDSKHGAGVVRIPAGCYLITSTLNATNTRVAGTHMRDGLSIIGDGRASVLIGKTGAGNAVIETSGSQFLRLEGLWIDTSSQWLHSGQSTIGILQAVGRVLPQTQNQSLRDLYIHMHDNPAANAGVGTVGIWNFGAEENTYGPLWIFANTAMVLTAHNDGKSQPGPFAVKSYQALLQRHSLGMTTFNGECFLVANNRRSPPLIADDVNTVSAKNLYLSAIGAAGPNKFAIDFRGYAVNWDLHGLIESLETVRVRGGLLSSRMDLTWGRVRDTAAPVLAFERAPNSGLVRNTDISVWLQSASKRPLFFVNAKSPTDHVGASWANARFKTNQSAQYVEATPANGILNLLWSPATKDAEILAYSDVANDSFVWRTRGAEQSIAIKDRSIPLANQNESAGVARILLPAIEATGRNGGGLSVEVEGLLSAAGASGNSSAHFKSVAAISLRAHDGGIVVGRAATPVFSASANTDTHGDSISAVELVIKGVRTRNYIDVSLAPLLGDKSAAKEVRFSGTVHMLWGGFDGSAPQLVYP